MRRFLPALRHRPLFKNAPCECTLNKFGLHFRHCHQRTKHCQCLQRKTSWRTVAVPRKANTTAATANLSSTRVRPPVTTAIAASSPDNHHVQAPRHPAPKSEALSEILDLLDSAVVLPDFLLVAHHHSGPTAQKLPSVIAVSAPISKLTALKHNVPKQSVTADLGTNDSSFNTTSCTR